MALFPNHLFPHTTYRHTVSGRLSMAAYCMALVSFTVIFEGFIL